MSVTVCVCVSVCVCLGKPHCVASKKKSMGVCVSCVCGVGTTFVSMLGQFQVPV